MVYQVFLACSCSALLAQVAGEIRQSGIPAVVNCYCSVGGLMAAKHLSCGDVALLDAALAGSDVAIEALAGALPKGRLLIRGETRDERLAMAAVRVGASRVGADEDIVKSITALLEEKPILEEDAERRIERVMSANGLSTDLKGSRYIAEALRGMAADSFSAENLTNGLYREIAERCHDTARNVERSIRYAIEKSWEHMNGAQRRRLMSQRGRRPGNRAFLRQMARQIGCDWERGDVGPEIRKEAEETFS